MLKKLNDLYEQHKIYQANPCDVGAAPLLRRLGYGISTLATTCRCCSGARVGVVAVLAALYPAATLITLAAVVVAMTIKGEPAP